MPLTAIRYDVGDRTTALALRGFVYRGAYHSRTLVHGCHWEDIEIPMSELLNLLSEIEPEE